MFFRKRDGANGSSASGKSAAKGAPGLPRGASAGPTVIGQKSRFKGTLKGEGSVLVCGTLRGGIDIKGPLTIALQGTVEADVDVQSAQVTGRARGKLRAASSVQVDSTGVVEGEVATPVIDLKPGSVLRGRASIAGLASRRPSRPSH